MSKSYSEAPPEVRDRLNALIAKFYPDLAKVKANIDLVFATTDTEGGNAVSHGGYRAFACIKIIGLKDRAMGRGDAEITIDQIAYEAMSGEERDALLDHELYHLVVKLDSLDNPKRDDNYRPMFSMRRHDFQAGWFIEIARRHQENAHEIQQAERFRDEHGQLFFGFTGLSDSLKSVVEATISIDGKPIRKPLRTVSHDGTVVTDEDGDAFLDDQDHNT